MRMPKSAFEHAIACPFAHLGSLDGRGPLGGRPLGGRPLGGAPLGGWPPGRASLDGRALGENARGTLGEANGKAHA